MTDLVIDASALVEAVRATALGVRVQTRIFYPGLARHVHSGTAVETTSALRGLVLGGKLDAARAEAGVTDTVTFPAVRHDVEPLLPRTWSLRANLTTYDALYVALAESLEAPLVTCDAKFDTPTIRRLIDVEVIS